jgi:hypothetical protein
MVGDTVHIKNAEYCIFKITHRVFLFYFRPVNVISSLNGVITNTTVSYEIRTTICLFEEYLKDCEVLDLYVIDEHLSAFIGHVTVRDLFTLVQENPYQCYLPIVNTFGTRIGDLHVGFMVQFIHQSKNVHYITNGITSDVRNMKEMLQQRALEYKENALDGLRHCHEHSKSPLKCKIPSSDTLPYTCDICKPKQSRGTQPISDSVISDILERGQRLRDAMIRSVLEDDTELVANDFDIGVRHSNSSADKIVDMWTEDRNMYFDDADVMEFLSGKMLCYKLSFNYVLFCSKIKNSISNQKTIVTTPGSYLFGCLKILTMYLGTFWVKYGFPSCPVFYSKFQHTFR